jgi:aminocarboxymuconate-semialdehyde decarboxylase
MTTRFATVDVHAHILLPGVMGMCGAAGPEMGRRPDGVQYFRSGSYVLEHVRFIESPFSDIRLRLELMDRLGIEHQVLSPNPLTYFYRQPVDDAVRFSRAHNEAVAEIVAAHPERFSAFASLPMQDPTAAVDELRRAVLELGLVGSYVGTDFDGRTLSDPAYERLWDVHAKLGVPLFVHPATIDAERRPSEAEAMRRWDLDIVLGFTFDETSAVAHLLFGGVLDRHPQLQAHVAHAGGAAPFVKGRFVQALEKRPWARGLLSRSLDELWEQISFDCLLHEPTTLEYLVRSQGAHRVLLGTNFAGWDQEDDIVDVVRALPISDAERELVLSGNAERLFARVRLGRK